MADPLDGRSEVGGVVGVEGCGAVEVEGVEGCVKAVFWKWGLPVLVRRLPNKEQRSNS